MKNRIMTTAGGLAVLGVLGQFYAKPLLAQVRAALVSSIDEPGRIPYTTAISSTGTTGSGAVFFAGSAVPANRRLVSTFVSGNIATGDTSATGVQEFFSSRQGQERGLVPVGSANTLSQPAQIYFNAGETPTVFTNKPPQGGGSEVIVSGYLLRLHCCRMRGSGPLM
jgi:hypothetical protein